MHLGDLGADVIKIEDTGSGDYARTAGAVHGKTSYFELVNRNKRSLTLDLKQAAGVAAFMRLAASADVIVEGFRPGVVDKLGIGYQAVAAINPRIVYCAITGYGQDGPYRDRAGHDLNYLAYSGLLDQIGIAGSAPAIPNFQIGDLLGGSLSALIGLLAGVVDARASGRGRYVDVSMTDAVFAHTLFPLLAVLDRGRAQPRGADLLSGGMPSYGVYATSDGRHLAVSAMEPKFWQTLCDTLDRPDLRPLRLCHRCRGAAHPRRAGSHFLPAQSRRMDDGFRARRLLRCAGPATRGEPRKRTVEGPRNDRRSRRCQAVRTAIQDQRAPVRSTPPATSRWRAQCSNP
jgi:alpha-methylacyl-CoA racemase